MKSRIVCQRVDTQSKSGEKVVEVVCKPIVQTTSHGRKHKVGKHPSNNIYLFGDSISDPGNLPFEQAPGPLLATSLDVPVGPVTFQFRVNADGRFTDGQTWAYFVAEDLGYEYILGSAINKLNPGHKDFVNFALAGASQTQNNVVFQTSLPVPVPHFASFKWQIERFVEMISRPGARYITRDDIFILAGLGGNDLLITLETAITLPQANWPALVASQVGLYVTSAVANITSLYNAGMRRLFLTVTDIMDVTILAAKYEVLAPGITAGFIVPTQAAFQASLLSFLDANKASLWPLLELNTSSLSSFFTSLLADASTNGIVLPPVGTFPNFNSIAGNGLWPVASPGPSSTLRSATNLLSSDDVHPTQHTHRLFADMYLDLLRPVPVHSSLNRNTVTAPIVRLKQKTERRRRDDEQMASISRRTHPAVLMDAKAVQKKVRSFKIDVELK